MIGKQPKKLLRDIRNYAAILEKSTELNFALNENSTESNFGLSTKALLTNSPILGIL